MKKWMALLFAGILIGGIMSGCGPKEEPAPTDTPPVATDDKPVGDTAAPPAGDTAAPPAGEGK